MKKILKVPLYLIVFLVVVISSAVYVYFFTTLPEAVANNWLTGFVAKNYGLEINFTKANRDIWNHLVLDGVEVISREGGKSPIAYISHLEANYDIGKLMAKNYHFSSITLDSIYFRYPKGGLVIPQKPEGKGKSAPISLSMDKVSVGIADVILPDGEQIDLDSLQLSLDIDKGNIKLILDKLAADWPDRDIRIPAIYAKASSDSAGFSIDTLDVSTERSHINISGRVGKPFTKNLDLKYYLSPISLVDLDSLARMKLSGIIEARGSFKGAIDDFSGEALVDGSFFDRPFDNVSVSYSLSDKVLKFDSIRGNVFKARFDGSGKIDFNDKPISYAYNGSVSHLNLQEIGPKLITDFSGTAHLTGSGLNDKELSMAITADFHDVKIDTYYFNEVSGPVQFDLRKINFLPGLKARYKSTYVDVQGSLEYMGNLDITGDVQFDDLTDFTNQIFIRELGGKGQAQFHATGPTLDFNVQGSFQSDSCWTYGLYPGHLGINVNLDTFISHRVGTVTGHWTGGTLYSAATDSGYFKTSVSGERAFIDTSHVDSPLGNITMKGEYDGVAVPPVFYADTVYGAVANDAFFSREPIKLDVLTTGIRFDQFSMGYGTGTIKISGIVSNELALDLIVQADSFQIGPFISKVYKDKAISGICSGRADIKGNFEKPVIDLDLTIDSLAINKTPLGILRSLASYKDGYLHADSTWLISEFGNYYLTGKLPMNLSFAEVQNRFPNDPIDLKLTAYGNRLLLSEVFIPNIERYETNFFVGMNLTGTYAHPLVTGRANLTDGRLKILDLVNPLINVNAYLRMENQTVMIDSVTASSAGSKEMQGILKELLPGVNSKKEPSLLRASGTMTLLKLGQFAYNIDVTGRNFYFMADAYDIQGIADFKMRVTGENIPTVSGQATLKRVDVRDEFTRFVGKEIDTSLVVEDSTVWNLNLHLTADNNLWITNNDVNAECKADVFVTRDVGLLNIIGTVDIIRGTYNLFGQKFDVKAGTMAFNNVARINPDIDFDVTTRLRNPTAQGASPTPVEIEITGTLLEPQINMTGETAMSKDDFLKLLLTGSNFNPFAVGAQNQGSLSSNLVRSFSAVSSFIPDPFVASGLVQEFEIAPADTGSGTQISVARYISRSLYVSISQTIAQGQSQAQTPSQSSGTIVIEYFLNNNVSFQVARGTQGSPNEGISFDINLNFEY